MPRSMRVTVRVFVPTVSAAAGTNQLCVAPVLIGRLPIDLPLTATPSRPAAESLVVFQRKICARPSS